MKRSLLCIAIALCAAFTLGGYASSAGGENYADYNADRERTGGGTYLAPRFAQPQGNRATPL